MRWWLALLSAAALSVGAGAQDQTSCTPSSAREVALLDVVGDPSLFSGECISVTAPSNGAMMYSGIDGYYLAGPLVGGADDDGPVEGRVLGFEPLQLVRWPDLWQVRATGIFSTCAQLQEAVRASSGPEAIIFMTGYCHHSNGPILTSATIEYLRPLAFERKVGEEQRRRFGDLVVADRAWPHYAAASTLAVQFLDAIQRDDTATILRLHGLEHDSWPDEIADTLAATFGTRSAFSRIEEDSEPQLAILVDADVVAGGEGLEPDEYEALLCFCLDGDCRDRWPISTVDADNAFTRPYACTEIDSYRWDSGERGQQFKTVLTPYAILFEPVVPN